MNPAAGPKPRSTLSVLPAPPGARFFDALTYYIEELIATGKSPYPVERTLLVSGILDASMHSRAAGNKPLATPELEFSYAPQDFSAFCETGESWKVITPDMPEPRSFQPGTG